MESRQDESLLLSPRGTSVVDYNGFPLEERTQSTMMDARILSNATSVATAAARSVLYSGGSEAAALKTARAAAQSIIASEYPEDMKGSGPKSMMKKRKVKQQADVLASMALHAAANNNAAWDDISAGVGTTTTAANTSIISHSQFQAQEQQRRMDMLQLQRQSIVSPSAASRTSASTYSFSRIMDSDRGFASNTPVTPSNNSSTMAGAPKTPSAARGMGAPLPMHREEQLLAATKSPTPSEDIKKKVAIRVESTKTEAAEHADKAAATLAASASSEDSHEEKSSNVSNTVETEKVEDDPIYFAGESAVTHSALTNDHTEDDGDVLLNQHHIGSGRYNDHLSTSFTDYDDYTISLDETGSMLTNSTIGDDEKAPRRGNFVARAINPIIFGIANACSCGPSPPVADIQKKEKKEAKAPTEQRQPASEQAQAKQADSPKSLENVQGPVDLDELEDQETREGPPIDSTGSHKSNDLLKDLEEAEREVERADEDLAVGRKERVKAVRKDIQKKFGTFKNKSFKLTRKSVSYTKMQSAKLKRGVSGGATLQRAEV